MKVLLVHNRYQHAGGEDRVFDDEARLLEKAGYTVERLQLDNDDIGGTFDKVRTAAKATYSLEGKRLVAEAIESFAPDVMHVHNFFPKFSPSIFDAARKAGVASVLTLHNFRITCANGTLFRNGQQCQLCIGNAPLPAIRHKCYRNSMLGSAALATMITSHRALGTWEKKVNRFIVLSSSARQVFARSGLPEDKMAIKPNSIRDPETPIVAPRDRKHFLYVGRLSPEKGADILVNAWNGRREPLLIFGNGPEKDRLAAKSGASVDFMGHQPSAKVADAIAHARAVIVPSLCHEMFGLVAAEAMAAGTPVIASASGSLEDIVVTGETGFLVEPGNPAQISGAVDKLSSDALVERLGMAGRTRYEENYTASHSLDVLGRVYRDALASLAK